MAGAELAGVSAGQGDHGSRGKHHTRPAGQPGTDTGLHRNSTVVRAVRDQETMLSRQRLSAPDRSRAFQSFVASIRATTQADITQARQALRYDYFTQSLRDEAEVREEMYKLFDRLLKSR